ncbi:MAG: NAD(P)-binding domain-containing protein [Candidatus Omnitrophica bacterium]|nr:NAD(P)-binding domain-containing protein [Candidatus Omnitrophota bacterium]
MKNKGLVKIIVSRTIPADIPSIVRALSKVEEFPEYIATIKQASIIEKSRNKMKTKWLVQVDHVPISWIEEDTLNLIKNTITFKAVEGDLQEFKGEWKFQAKPEGTLVTVTAYLRIDIPAIKDFVNTYVEKMLVKNFTAILKGIEKRLISIRYKGQGKDEIKKIAGFGIIGHLYNFYHLEKCLKMLNPDFKMPSREFLGNLFNVTPSFKLYDIVDFKSKSGGSVDGCFIVATFIPDLIEKDIWSIFSKVVRACKIAEKHGVGIVTLGGFTSIVAERIGQAISEQVNVPITTGNTFTAAMTLEGVYRAVRALNLDIGSLKVAIVGGTGDIGSACARVLADQVKQLSITGRTKANLKQLKQELSKKHKARIVATTNNKKAVSDADVIIAAASATESILSIDWFKPGAIICDVGYPKNISYAQTERDDILIFSGGLARSPSSIKLPIDLGLPNSEVIYGCFAEAIILSLEKRYENYSFGRGNITPEKIKEIKELGEKHGFEVSRFWWGDRLLDQAAIDRIKERVNLGKEQLI